MTLRLVVQLIDSLSLGSVLALIRIGGPVKLDQRDEPQLVVYGALHKQNEVLYKKVFVSNGRRAVDGRPLKSYKGVSER